MNKIKFLIYVYYYSLFIDLIYNRLWMIVLLELLKFNRLNYSFEGSFYSYIVNEYFFLKDISDDLHVELL